VSYQPKNAAGKYCGKAVVTEIIGRDEMMGEVEGDSLPIETVDGRMVMDLKDVTRLIHTLGGRNGQSENAAPNPTAGIDPGAIASLSEGYQAIIGVQTGLVKSMSESMKALAESRPAPAPISAPQDPSTAPAIVEMQTKLKMMEQIIGLSPEKQSLALQMVDRFFGGGEESGGGISWQQVIKGVVEGLANSPVAAALLMRLMPQGQAPIPQGAAPGAPGQLPAPMPAQPAADPSETMLAQVVQQIHFALSQGQSVYGVEDTIERLIAGFPDSRAAQVAQMIVTQPVEEVVKHLGLTQPEAATWVKTLQDDYREEQEHENPGEAEPEILTFGAGNEG
jgi:hypothetical protein